jgi:outer membrane protein assembly factor BamB
MPSHCIGTPAVKDGLVFIADAARTLHCINASDGQPVWTHKAGGEFWSSPLVADGKVYIGSRKGDFLILSASREKKILCDVDLGAPIAGTATAANGTLYIATMQDLWAIGK